METKDFGVGLGGGVLGGKAWGFGLWWGLWWGKRVRFLQTISGLGLVLGFSFLGGDFGDRGFWREKAGDLGIGEIGGFRGVGFAVSV